MRSLYDRIGHLIREVAAFGAVGAIGVVINFAVFNALVHGTSLQTVRSSVIATCVAIVANYIGYRYWVYRHTEKHTRSREILLFLAFSAVGLVIENGVLYATAYWIGWDSHLQNNIFKFVGMAIATLFRFGCYRTWVFRKKVVVGADATSSGASRTLSSQEPARAGSSKIQRG